MPDKPPPKPPTPDPNTIPELVDFGKSLDASDQTAEQSHYAIGVLINQGEDAGLPKKHGFPDMAHLVRALRPGKYSSYMMYARVARACSADDEKQLGMAKLDDALRYVKGKTPPAPGTWGQLMISVPQKQGDPVAKLLSQCSVAEVLHAIAALTPPTPLPASSEALRKAILEALQTNVGKHAAVEAAPEADHAVFSLLHIPEPLLVQTLQAVMEAVIGQNSSTAK